jgi:hypothetical protein
VFPLATNCCTITIPHHFSLTHCEQKRHAWGCHPGCPLFFYFREASLRFAYRPESGGEKESEKRPRASSQTAVQRHALDRRKWQASNTEHTHGEGKRKTGSVLFCVGSTAYKAPGILDSIKLEHTVHGGVSYSLCIWITRKSTKGGSSCIMDRPLHLGHLFEGDTSPLFVFHLVSRSVPSSNADWVPTC